MATDKPILHALVAYVSPVFGVVGEPRMMPLEEALDYATVGFAVLVDPMDEAELVRWEQLQRAMTTHRKWYDQQ